MPSTVARRICPFCEACCGLAITVDDGRVTHVRGDDDDIFSKGFVCPKGFAIKDLHDDPDRLRSPLVKRGDTFVETSWDDAFAEIARRLPPILAEGGRDAAAMVIGNPTVHKAGLLLYGQRLTRALGTRNVFSASTLDQMPKQRAVGEMFGHWLTIPVPDLERAEILVVLGANPVVSNGSLWTVPDFRGKARALRARGGKMIVVDPRRTETADVADEHVFIRPGGDVFFLLGLVHALLADGPPDLGPVGEHVAGLEDLAMAVRAFAPERLAARCGIEVATTQRIASELRARPGAIYGRLGTCTQTFGTVTSWLVDVANVLSGHFDRPGGAMFPRAAAFAANTAGAPATGKGITVGRRRSRVSGAAEVFGELPIGCLAEEIDTPGDGRVRALFTMASNPVLSAPDGPRLSRALASLDLMVSVDVYLNETTRHADVILPGSSPLEEMHFDVVLPQFGYRNAARASLPVFSKPATEPLEWEVLLRLAAIAEGRGADTDLAAFDDELTVADLRRVAGPGAEDILAMAGDRRGPARLVDLALRAGPYGDMFGARPDGLSLDRLLATPTGVDLGPLTSRVPEVLRTPSGKIELAPAAFVADLARVANDLASPSPELVVIGRRDLRSNNSWMHNLPSLAKGPFRCTARVHPDDAARLGLASGALATISRGDRSIEAQVEVSDEMMPGVVSVPHGWGHDLPGVRLAVAGARPGVNLNALLDHDQRDPLSGNAVLGGVAVTMTPALS